MNKYLIIDQNDNVAVAMACIENEKIYTKVWAFIPANRVDIRSKKENIDYRRMIRNGYN